MNLVEKWESYATTERSTKEQNKFWVDYFEKEKNAYSFILENNKKIFSAKLNEIATELNLDDNEVCGFLNGINTSLVNSIDLENINLDENIEFEIEYEKLYYNMLDAKANWLYLLPQWQNILSTEKIEEITKQYKKDTIAVSTKVGRNEPCTCGSGKKYKKCCGQ